MTEIDKMLAKGATADWYDLEACVRRSMREAERRKVRGKCTRLGWRGRLRDKVSWYLHTAVAWEELRTW